MGINFKTTDFGMVLVLGSFIVWLLAFAAICHVCLKPL